MSEHIESEYRDGVHILRMARPEKKNALTQAMYTAMVEALQAAEADDNVRVHVLFGTPGAFSAGNDIADFMAVAQGGSLAEPTRRFLELLPGLTKPLITGADGIAVGIGATIHFHADLTFATPATRFHTPFVDLALVPEAGSSLLLPQMAGHQRAFALLCAGIPFSAEEARDAGIIWKVVDAAELETETLNAAAALAGKPPKALRLARDLLKRTGRDAVAARIDEEVALFGQQLKSPEALAAFQAFMARKK
ncbi:crotonase/enoyl-CoA hydratase family protein [Pseudohoeflea coraliihabitans]|uniref:Crotonase/enoyl-CoA hydratase family protein n=1 Tax=Pseudohoeflea coraliihabitans TaxID=2860393 RepID=A0ABS6WNH0_9HYPH|nr:crotonase/enoyl-CoA hydratase family protein [Pseudohoeflea sp. DP4N28-3]MBW3096957.1 crotonase/enoyl-CoA hydratase family protein [Pseudohoeflea sp. DP4N28-3]